MNDLFPDCRKPISPFYRRSDPATSREAIELHTQSGSRETHCQQVWFAVKENPGKTYRELASIIGMDAVELMRRLNDLRQSGLVRSGDVRRCTVGAKNMMTWFAG